MKLTSSERSNINKRIRVLKILFNIEDSIVKTVKGYYPKNQYLISEIISKDKDLHDFVDILKYRSNKNIAIRKTFTSPNIKLHDFLEVSSLGDLVAILSFSKPGLKKEITPKGWTFKETKQVLKNLTKLRNKVSHSSLNPIDDHIYGLPQIQLSLVGNKVDRKAQYIAVLKSFSNLFELPINDIKI